MITLCPTLTNAEIFVIEDDVSGAPQVETLEKTVLAEVSDIGGV